MYVELYQLYNVSQVIPELYNVSQAIPELYNVSRVIPELYNSATILYQYQQPFCEDVLCKSTAALEILPNRDGNK